MREPERRARPADGTRVTHAGMRAIVAGGHEGKVRIRLEAEDYMLRRSLLVDAAELEAVDPAELEPSDLEAWTVPLCSSCGGSGAIEWTDDDGWQHEAPCETCARRDAEDDAEDDVGEDQ
ncbi:hypothetical protein [Streptomyces sp. G45]|uniref:hypothetical protein n=1 Tax=Streptomyces sp. G45 TaxID=3406627 RepID=UPI003C18250B